MAVTTIDERYLLSARERDKIRQDRIKKARDHAEPRARALFSSLKCSGYEGLAAARHAGEPDGCRNDGSTCLCECHDPQESR